jgi:glycosyltransferase involved in cell wall biosynthesis
MKVFMLGWEFPPFISGGLGTACYGLTRAMDELGLKVTFVLPKSADTKYAKHIRLLSPSALDARASSFSEGGYEEFQNVSFEEKFDSLKNVSFRHINSALKPYSTPESSAKRVEQLIEAKKNRTLFNSSLKWREGTQIDESMDFDDVGDGDYQGDMYTEVQRYAVLAAALARREDFDIIHIHDWMTYPAGINAAAATGKPLIAHIHSTEFDRSGENVNQMIYEIERSGMNYADKVIAVSGLTKKIVVERYGIDPEKVEVVHNGVDLKNKKLPAENSEEIKKNEKIVLFLGRITMQKGPEYFLQAAKKVLDVMDDVKFVMAGSGDMMYRMVEMAAGMGIGNKVIFTGFLRGDAVNQIYRMADLFVMPSVSEPFGIVPLEALDNDVPVIISKQSGVSEILRHALKVDFWDTDEMANKITAVLKYQPLKFALQNHGNFEVRKISWKDTAEKCIEIYQQHLAVV